MLPDDVQDFVSSAVAGDTDALQALLALSTNAATSDAARRELSSLLERQLASAASHCAEAWMLLATLHEAAGETQSALRSWYHSAQPHAKRDAARMHVLGIDTEATWTSRAAQVRKMRAEYLRDAFSDIRRAHGPRELFRIDRALAGYLGEASVFSSHPTQRPKLIFIPGLGTSGFLDPHSHPIVPALRHAFRDVQAEYDELMSDQQTLEPFLGHAGGGALEGYVSGGDKASWDAFFFFRHGHRFEASHQRCPRTSALLDSLDLCSINGQSPEICFSVLQPGSRIEPHFGVTNARVVVHLPLRVPSGCHIELTGVGRHDWVEGEPMVFDDTFEHSALNPSGEPRSILLMDAWHPSLSLVERKAFSCLIEAISSIERD
jgi:aspartate beta-hydroxylase